MKIGFLWGAALVAMPASVIGIVAQHNATKQQTKKSNKQLSDKNKYKINNVDLKKIKSEISSHFSKKMKNSTNRSSNVATNLAKNRAIKFAENVVAKNQNFLEELKKVMKKAGYNYDEIVKKNQPKNQENSKPEYNKNSLSRVKWVTEIYATANPPKILSSKKSPKAPINTNSNSEASIDDRKYIEDPAEFNKLWKEYKFTLDNLYNAGVDSAVFGAVATSIAAGYWAAVFFSLGATTASAIAATVQAAAFFVQGAIYGTTYELLKAKFDPKLIEDAKAIRDRVKIVQQIFSATRVLHTAFIGIKTATLFIKATVLWTSWAAPSGIPFLIMSETILAIADFVNSIMEQPGKYYKIK